MPDAQPEMFDSLDAELFLCPPAQRMARCTAKQAAKIEQLLILVRKLIAYGCPVAEITRDARISERVVNAIVLHDLEAATTNRAQATETLRRIGARWIGKAITQEHTAEFKDLVTAGNAMLQRAAEAAAGMGLEAQEKSASEILDAGATGQASALDDIRRLLGFEPIRAAEPGSVSNPLTTHLEQGIDLQELADSTPSRYVAEEAETPVDDQAETVSRGGGCDAEGAGDILMDQDGSQNFVENLRSEGSGDSRKIPATIGDEKPANLGKNSAGELNRKQAAGQEHIDPAVPGISEKKPAADEKPVDR